MISLLLALVIVAYLNVSEPKSPMGDASGKAVQQTVQKNASDVQHEVDQAMKKNQDMLKEAERKSGLQTSP